MKKKRNHKVLFCISGAGDILSNEHRSGDNTGRLKMSGDEIRIRCWLVKPWFWCYKEERKKELWV
ncbi:hypothetical protein DEO72_LG5g1657 [Vigna unguiculata]|uniref:Uncharacterized protein n=1 Tax=Vigna unguiculata TaxID=3917 RepID=A0A4D6LXG1_VIGUN|nr:hypothetical protein DEO72_LG5g1657 [Vigna unguiculata]